MIIHVQFAQNLVVLVATSNASEVLCDADTLNWAGGYESYRDITSRQFCSNFHVYGSSFGWITSQRLCTAGHFPSSCIGREPNWQVKANKYLRQSSPNHLSSWTSFLVQIFWTFEVELNAEASPNQPATEADPRTHQGCGRTGHLRVAAEGPAGSSGNVILVCASDWNSVLLPHIVYRKKMAKDKSSAKQWFWSPAISEKDVADAVCL